MRVLNVLFFCLLAISLSAQQYNYKAFDEVSQQVVHAGFGADYGFTTNLGYGYQFEWRDRKMILNTDFTFPTGKKFLDDFKLRLGAQLEFYSYKGWTAAGRLYTSFRKVNNGHYIAQNFGADMALLLGYYHPKWYVAGEFGFDKAIISHVQHSEWYEGVYPEVYSGWLAPMGGNYNIGVQGGYSFDQVDILLRFGILKTQDWQNLILGFYGTLNVNYRF